VTLGEEQLVPRRHDR